jgi:uncharacterized protein (TIGR02722 family)
MKQFSLFCFLSLSILAGCGPSREVSRISADQQTDLSGKWNDTDSRLVAEQMVSSLTSRPWLGEYLSANGKKPTVIVGTIRNLSSEHIQTDIFVKDIERELVNSGKVIFVASKQEREEVREERLDQQVQATEESAKKLAAELGADFMLKGSIKDQVDRVDGTETKFYQVDMELINVETNEKTWIDTKKIKKLVKRSGSSW